VIGAMGAEADDDELDDEPFGAPLWISDKNQPTSSDIAVCHLCGSMRKFEFQVMPQAIQTLHASELDFGVIAIFTCSSSCAVADGYAEEFAWVQSMEQEVEPIAKAVERTMKLNSTAIVEESEDREDDDVA
jgi:hypothetical protein